MNFNKEQKEAIESISGPTRIISGPGTGKTRTIIGKVLKILDEEIAKDHEVLIITFTNKAAHEIKERIEKNLQHKTNLNIFTYHG